MDRVRWGILGCGGVTEVKSGPGFQRAQELVSVMRRNRALAADYAKRHRVARWYDDPDQLINDPEVDAVYIATPPGSHCEYALRVCAAGKPAYVEKPMARNHAESMTMVEAFGARDVKLFVAYYRRALPRFLEAKSIVDAGRLGPVTEVGYRYAHAPGTLDPAALPWRLRAEESGGGLFFDLGSHALDILDFILGPLSDVTGTARNQRSAYDVEDDVDMRFRTESGAQGSALWNFNAAASHDAIEISGPDGRLTLAVFGDSPLRLTVGGKDEVLGFENPSHIEQPMIQSVVDELRGHGICSSSGVSGARTAAVMDAVTLSYYGSREVGFWERPESWPGRRRGEQRQA